MPKADPKDANAEETAKAEETTKVLPPFKAYPQMAGIAIHPTSAHNPQGDGLSEAAVKKVSRVIIMLINHTRQNSMPGDWVIALSAATSVWNCTGNIATGWAPNDLEYRHNMPLTRAEIILGNRAT